MESLTTLQAQLSFASKKLKEYEKAVNSLREQIAQLKAGITPDLIGKRVDVFEHSGDGAYRRSDLIYTGVLKSADDAFMDVGNEFFSLSNKYVKKWAKK